MRVFWVASLLAALVLSAAPGLSGADAEGPQLSPSHQAKLLLVALSFFRDMPSEGANLNVLVLGSCPLADALAEMDGKALNGRSLRMESLRERSSESALRKRFAERPYAAVVDCSRRTDHAKAVAAAASVHKVLHITGDSATVEAGAALGTEVRNGRPGLVLNLTTVRTLGISFDGRLAGAARILQ